MVNIKLIRVTNMFISMLLTYSYYMGARRRWWMPFWTSLATAGEWFVENTSNSRFKLIKKTKLKRHSAVSGPLKLLKSTKNYKNLKIEKWSFFSSGHPSFLDKTFKKLPKKKQKTEPVIYELIFISGFSFICSEPDHTSSTLYLNNHKEFFKGKNRDFL